MAQLFETLCMMLAFKESHSLAMHYCRLVWDVRSLSKDILILYQYMCNFVILFLIFVIRNKICFY